MADYIVATGTDDSCYWEKYNSGIAKIWFKPQTPTNANGYFAAATFTLPFSVTPISAQTSYTQNLNSLSSTDYTVSIGGYLPASATTEVTCWLADEGQTLGTYASGVRVLLFVIGKWK